MSAFSCTMSAWHPPINRPSPPDAVVTLAEVMQGIRAPHPDTVTTVAHIRSAIANNDKPAADEAKGARLHYITPAATFGKRRAISEVVALSGLVVIDVDHLDGPAEAIALRDQA